ncbi:unnamed protein product [Rotaria socialis]
MTTNRIKYLWKKNFHIHHMNDCDDLNFYYKKFLNKLSKLCLKVFLPLLSLIYLFTLFLCRLFLSTQTYDIRTICLLVLIFLSFILLILIRLHKKGKKLWALTRLLIIVLLVVPLVISYQTEQFHILLSSISIILIYALLTFTLLQSLLISISISILHISLLLNDRVNQIQWKSLEFLSIIIYHIIINIFGLYSYIRSIKHIRQHFYAYKKNLLEKNKYNVDCKKLHTIIGHCQQTPTISNINFRSKFGTVINCSISLNEQTRTHTCDELASLIDVLYCQIEQLIITSQPTAHFIFDNETIVITLLNETNNEQFNIDNSCRLAVELFRFIQHVNNITQWNLRLNIGIDYNQINILSSQYIEGLAYDYSRWLREECLIHNRIHVSSRIYEILKENQFYKFSLITNHSTYLLSNENIYEIYNNAAVSINMSDMIDQLTRIQVDYYVKKHLDTKTLIYSLRKLSLFDLTSKFLHWFSLNFKEQYLTNDFQIIHRTNRPNSFIYIFILLILIGSLLQSFVIDYSNMYYLILFPIAIIGLVLCIIIFYCSIHMNDRDKDKKFYVYLNILICITLTILVFVAIQYHSIQNFKCLFISTQSNNETVTTMLNNLSIDFINSTVPQPLFSRQFHEYLVLSPIYPLYFCTLFRQCSWLIKTLFIIICSILQLYMLEYIWLTTNTYFSSINALHHYTAFTLIIFHNFLLIILSYIHEWLEKIDFIWFKQIDNERLIIIRQRNQLIKQTSFILPLRVINYYLDTNSNLSLSQHYHYKYDQMGLLYVRFDLINNKDEYSLISFINNIEYTLKNNDKYANMVMHKKSTPKEIIFSMDLKNSLKSIQELAEFLFQINEHQKSFEINLTACLHVGSINEILIHFEKFLKVDIWSEHISFIQLLMSKVQNNHCLVTSSVYNLLNDLYLFRIAGSIINTSMNIENNTSIYFLLGRLIGDNIFQGRNALPLTINQSNNDTIPKSSSVDGSQVFQYPYKHSSHNDKNPSTTTTTTTTTTSSSGILNDQKCLLKQSSQKHNRTSHANSSQSSYRHTLLHSLDPTTTSLKPMNPIKKLSKLIHSNENACWPSKEVTTDANKYLVLTQNLFNKSADDNNRCKSSPPLLNRPVSSEQNISIEDQFNQLLQEQSSKDIINLSHSLSTTNEETTSSFSGWDDPSCSLLPANNEIQQEVIKPASSPPIIDCYYPSHPSDLSFIVNMTITDPIAPTATVTSQQPQQQQEILKLRTKKFNLAHKLIAETSESEISIQHEPWTQNIVYQSRHHQRTGLSASYNNLSKFHSKDSESSSICQLNFLQNWLEDQLSQFRVRTKTSRKPNRFSAIENDSTDDDSDKIQDNTYPILKTKSTKQSCNYTRYKQIRKNEQLIRHESLKHRNKPLSFENNNAKKLSKRADSSSLPHSDLSDVSSSRPDNLSKGILSSFESDYDNMGTEELNSNPTTTTIMNNSEMVTEDDDSDDQTTLATAINRRYL